MAIKEASDQMEKKPTNHLLRMLGIFFIFFEKNYYEFNGHFKTS